MEKYLKLTSSANGAPLVVGNPIYIAIKELVSYTPVTDPKKVTYLITTAKEYFVSETAAEITELLVLANKTSGGTGGSIYAMSAGQPTAT